MNPYEQEEIRDSIRHQLQQRGLRPTWRDVVWVVSGCLFVPPLIWGINGWTAVLPYWCTAPLGLFKLIVLTCLGMYIANHSPYGKELRLQSELVSNAIKNTQDSLVRANAILDQFEAELEDIQDAIEHS